MEEITASDDPSETIPLGATKNKFMILLVKSSLGDSHVTITAGQVRPIKYKGIKILAQFHLNSA
jgi:hypothetical protein